MKRENVIKAFAEKKSVTLKPNIISKRNKMFGATKDRPIFHNGIEQNIGKELKIAEISLHLVPYVRLEGLKLSGEHIRSIDIVIPISAICLFEKHKTTRKKIKYANGILEIKTSFQMSPEVIVALKELVRTEQFEFRNGDPGEQYGVHMSLELMGLAEQVSFSSKPNWIPTERGIKVAGMIKD